MSEPNQMFIYPINISLNPVLLWSFSFTMKIEDISLFVDSNTVGHGSKTESVYSDEKRPNKNVSLLDLLELKKT